MRRIHYTIQHRQQLPAEIDWLTPDERACYEGFRFAKRRNDWLLGRRAAKIALLAVTGLPPQGIGRIEIATDADGAPRAKLDGAPCAAALSLSHSNERALAAATEDTIALGCDIESVESRSAGFVETFFTAAERKAVERAAPADRDAVITLIWSVKESALKALRTGLRADTRSVEVVLEDQAQDSGWQSARAVTSDNGEFACQWRRDGHFIVTLVTRGPAREPRLIAI